MNRINFLLGALLVFVTLGCDNVPDTDLGPVMAPVQNRNEEEANAFRNWIPTEEDLASLAIAKEKNGPFSALLSHAKWSGNRLRVTGIKDGLPVTESIGAWHVIVVPTSDSSIVELKGFLFAENFSVKLNLAQESLIIKDAEFQGSSIKGNSPMFQNLGFQGFKFERKLGLVLGSASLLFLEDGSIVFDFDKVVVNGARAREYGVLEAVK